MQDTSQTPLSPMKKRILIICGVVVFLVVVSLGTVFILKSLVPKKEVASAHVAVNADELVAMYRVPGAVKGLSDSLYDQQLDNGMSVPLVYKSGNHAYIVSTLARSNVLFSSKSVSSQDDTKAIQDQTTVFMHNKGYEKVKTPKSTESENLSRATYTSDQAVCQLTSSNPVAAGGSPTSHQLACATNSVIEDEYTATEKLLNLYGKPENRPSFTEAVRSSVKEENKAYSILHLATGKRPLALLFASVNENWSYIGDLNSPDGESNSKYVITPDVKTKISDPKYGDFLTKNLQGHTSS